MDQADDRKDAEKKELACSIDAAKITITHLNQTNEGPPADKLSRMVSVEELKKGFKRNQEPLSAQEWTQLCAVFACQIGCGGVVFDLSGIVDGVERNEMACQCADKVTTDNDEYVINASAAASVSIPSVDEGDVDLLAVAHV